MGEPRWNADCLQRTGMKTVNVRATPALERPGRLGKVWLPEGPGGVTRGRRSPSHSPELKWSLDSHTQRQKERACQSMHTHPGRGRPRRQDPACAPESGGPRPTEGTRARRVALTLLTSSTPLATQLPVEEPIVSTDEVIFPLTVSLDRLPPGTPKAKVRLARSGALS